MGARRRSTPPPATGFCAACHETTGGNPFLLSELLHEVLDKQLRATDAEAATVHALGPEAISTVVLQRLARLPAAAPALARAVAILGEGASPALAAELAGLDAATAEEALEALCRADVLPATARGSASCTRSCSQRSTTTCPSRRAARSRARRPPAARAGAAPEEVASQLR